MKRHAPKLRVRTLVRFRKNLDRSTLREVKDFNASRDETCFRYSGQRGNAQDTADFIFPLIKAALAAYM